MTSSRLADAAINGPWPLWAGLGVLAATWLGPLPTMSRTAFSPGMLTHLCVIALAAPLLTLGAGRLDGVSKLRAGNSAVWALAAALFDAVVVLGWHIPALHEQAARSWISFSLEQFTFLVAGIAMWSLMLDRRTVKTALWGAAAFFMTFTHMTVLGCLLLLAPHLLYDPDVCRGAFGLSPLDDQQLGGALMLAWGSFVYLAGGVAMLLRVFPLEESSRFAIDRPGGHIWSGDRSLNRQPNV